ncbi:GlcG/HbpS family heme-binding protein [Zymobacter palmae]|uniref:Heme-binding protein n=1 Tax=Zymobacter palmae TaxID=33074 RepID=A0A348HIH8_9GAMM|nr:heme-binding protein [Zymobacter palmae]BBG31430.1 uncharacterized protein ZBT109_2705 [Zymobacter palmae]
MTHSLTETLIQQTIARAQTRAREQGYAVCIAVVDDSGLLRGFLRMDDAVPGASIKKARTASLFRTDSLDLGQMAQPGGAIYTLEATNGGLISFGGGIVLHGDDGRMIGAVGVAGATVPDDQALALYAAGRV